MRFSIHVGGLAMLTLSTQVFADVKIESPQIGTVTITSSTYSATLAHDGCLQSVRTGGVEMLGRYRRFRAGSFLADEIPPGGVGIVSDKITRLELDQITIGRNNNVIAKGDGAELKYVFRETEFDLQLKSDASRGPRLMLFPSEHVVNSIDSITDRAISMSEGNAVGQQQEGMRWATRQGPILKFIEQVDGYTSFYWWSDRHGGKQRAVSLPSRSRPPTFTIRPLPKPGFADAIQCTVKADDPGFLMPGGAPVQFDAVATNLTSIRQQGQVDFEVRDYRTRKVVATSTTELDLMGGKKQRIEARVPLEVPGPYRGVLVIKQEDKTLREIEWIFTYDFPNYTPALTRSDDFEQFWKSTLAELAEVPLDARIKLNEERSTDLIAVYEVSLATLNGQRFWAWYCRPRKDGKYPVYYFCPSSGVYPMSIRAGTGGGQYATLSIAIHPWDLNLSDMPKDSHPWKGYHTAGIESPKTTSWRTIYASLVRGMDFLVSRPEVDPNRIAVGGSSQGGGLAMVLAGLDERVAVCLPQYSGLPRLDWTVEHETGYWPFKMQAKPEGQTKEQFFHTLAYFDAANFTSDIRCPTVALIGMQDWVTASGNQIAALAHLSPGNVELICDPWGGHGSSTLQLRNQFNRALTRYISGESPIVTPSK